MDKPTAPQILRCLALTVVSTALLAAPASAQMASPPGLDTAMPPSDLPPVTQSVPPAPSGQTPPSAQVSTAPADRPPAKDPAPVESAPPVEATQTEVGPRPAGPALRKTQVRAKIACRVQPKRLSAAQKRAARRRCVAARQAVARLMPAQRVAAPARLRAVGGKFGWGICNDDNGKTLYQQPPSVTSDRVEWVAHWNASAYSAGSEWEQPSDWIGPFWSRTDNPTMFSYQGVWKHADQGGGWSAHNVGLVQAGGARATGVQVVRFYDSNHVQSVHTITTGCEGTRSWFTGT